LLANVLVGMEALCHGIYHLLLLLRTGKEKVYNLSEANNIFAMASTTCF